MRRNARLTCVIFGIWGLLLFGVAILNPGELALSAHLWLVLSGLPSALLSFHFQHGSVLAVAVAALLGLLQWVLLAQLDSWLVERKNGKSE